MINVKLKVFEEENATYTFPCVEGVLAEMNAITSGSKTDSHGTTWNCTASTSGTYHNVTFSKYGANYTVGTLEEIFESLGFQLHHWANDYADYLPASDTLKTLVPNKEDAPNFPGYKYRNYNLPDSGNMKDRKGDNFTFAPTNSYNSTWVDYNLYSGANITNRIRIYGGIMALKTASGHLGWVFGQCYISINRWSSSAEITMRFTYDTSLGADNFLEVEYEPGDKGFKPTAARTTPNRPGIGGRGGSGDHTPKYLSDSVTQPGAPDESQASAIGSGFLNCYKITTSNLHNMGACLYGETLLDIIKTISINPLDFIVSLMVFPCAPDVGASEEIRLGRWVCTPIAINPNGLGTNASGNKLTKQFKVFDMGTITIPEEFGSFLDYDHTEVELYLPFVGSVTLDASECMGGSINVQYTVDFFTGMCVANVFCNRSLTLASGYSVGDVSQHAYQGNCAIQIPLSAVNYGSMVGSLINACASGITNPANGIVTLGNEWLSGNMRPNVSSKGSIVANAGFCSVLYPYVRITRPITAEPETYQEVLGYPSYINTTIGQCDGLCVCEDIELSGLTGATASELARIKSLCREGVRN